MIIQNDKHIVSLYKNINDRYPTNVNVLQALMTYEFKKDINILRSYKYHSKEYNEFKTRLPCILANGTCERGKAKSAENVRINPTIIIDVDLEDNPHLLKNMSLIDWKYILAEQQDVIFICLSCGGSGLMILHRLSDSVTKETYIKYYKELEKRYKDKFGLTIDESCKNVNRLRYVTYDPDCIYNQIYEPLEIEIEEPIKETSSYKKDNNINIIFACDEFNLEDSKGPFYFGHSDRHKQKVQDIELEVPLISEVIHTLLCLYDIDTVKYIWNHNKFYLHDPKDVIRWIDNYKVKDENGNIVQKEEWRPNLKVIKFLNEWCGFNIGYNIKVEDHIDIEETDWVSEVFGRHDNIILGNNEYMYDKKDEILDKLSSYHINLILCPVGRGKTTFWNKLYTNEHKRILIIQPYKSIIKSKYKGIDCYLCVEKQKINPEYEYVITHYDNFCYAYEHNQLGIYDYIVIDESHLLGTQNFRSTIMLKTVKYIEQYNEENSKCKVVLMTGTASNETALFKNINTIINIEFEDKKFIGIQYMNIQSYSCTEEEETEDHTKYIVDIYNNNIIKSILYLSNVAKKEGRKVYVYWGTGSITNDETYQKAADTLNKMNIAVYHKRNEGNQDLIDIRENESIGNYDGLMSSCYFSVGCDLNDEVPAYIIIVGNNTYQEDAQVIGRFRKSKNIKVVILINHCYIPKYDCNEELDNEIKKIKLLSNSKNSKNTSLVSKLTTDEDIEKKAYIIVSQKYYSDIKRKFEYYRKMNWFMFNSYILDGNHYDIVDLEGNSIVYLIDLKTDVLKKIKDIRNSRVKEVKISIIHNLKTDNNYDMTEDYENCKNYPTLQDWIEAIQIFQKYYDVSRLFNLKSNILFNLSKKRLNILLRWMLNYKHNDRIENYIIEKILDEKETLKELKKNNVEEYIKRIGIYYLMWCSAYDDKNDYKFSTYDLNNRYTYPVYKQWKDNVESILDVEDIVREILMEDIYKKEIIDDFTKTFFNIPDDTEEALSYVKNKFLNKSDKIRFLENICRQLSNKDKHKIGGEIAGKKSSPKKEVIITELFKRPEKYNLEIGQIFPSCSDLANFTNKSNKTITSWISKKWVEKR